MDKSTQSDNIKTQQDYTTQTTIDVFESLRKLNEYAVCYDIQKKIGIIAHTDKTWRFSQLITPVYVKLVIDHLSGPLKRINFYYSLQINSTKIFF